MNQTFVLEAAPIQFVIIFSVLISFCIDHADAQGDPLLETTQFPCYSSENYTPNSPFQTNLNILLSSLVSNGSRDGFYNATVGVGPDIVYGLVQCRGDISQDSCRSCLYNSTVELIRRCPNRRVATLRYDHCLLRYSNTRFFSQVDTTPRSEYNPVRVSDADADRFDEQVKSLLTNVSGVAASRQNRFDRGTAEYTPSGDRIYGLVQCNEDLSPSNCTSCVHNLISNIAECCDKQLGAKIFSATCYLRYEQETSTRSPSPPLTEPNDTGGKRFYSVL